MANKSFSINVDKRPFDESWKLYTCEKFTFKPGINSLVGCNGSGKSTLINMFLLPALRKKNIGYLEHNDRKDGGNTHMQRLLFQDDFQNLANMAFSSEGERIVCALDPIFGSLRSNFNKHKGERFFIIMDAIDSGMSIDEIIEIRNTFLDVIIPDAKDTFDVDLYIIIAANNYEWCNDSRIHNICIYNSAELTFSNYEDYKEHILASRILKNQLRGIEE